MRQRAVEEIVGGQVGQQPALLQIDHAAGQAFDLAQVVAAENQRHAGLCKFGHQGLDLAIGGRVQAGRRFIEQQHIGPQRPGARQCEALLLPTRQGLGIARRQRQQADAFERAQRLGFGLFPGHALEPQAQRHIGLGTGAQHVGMLEQHGLAHRKIDLQAAAAGPHQAVQGAQQGAFAAAVGADQRHAFAGLDAQATGLERLHLAVVHAHTLQFKQRVHSPPPWGWAASSFTPSGGGSSSRRSRQRRTSAISTLSSSTTASSSRPSASASGKSPLLVSSAMAVVMTRVKPSMLPPTTITAPTSEIARPKAAISTVSRV
eukprot:Opistho-1_new@51144